MSEVPSYMRKEVLHPHELRGVFVPTLTPFKKEGDKIILDTISLSKHIEILADPKSQISGIFLASNAGQGRDMHMDTLKSSIKIGIKAARSVNRDLPVVVGALRKNIEEVLDVIKSAEENGADAVVLAPGYTQGDLDEILNIVTLNTKLPIILYNNPGFQDDKDLPPDFIERAAHNSQVIGIKDTSGKPEYFKHLLTLRSDRFHVMQGDTKAGLNSSIREADGMVPVEANLYSEIIAPILNPDNPYSSVDLQIKMDEINRNKDIYGGSTGFIIHTLVLAKIFESAIQYPKSD